MIVSLFLLDKLTAIAYDDTVTVTLAGELIGVCTLSKDITGRSIGTLEVNRELDKDLFFYYQIVPYKDQIPQFVGIQLNVNERPDTKTFRLKDAIIG